MEQRSEANTFWSERLVTVDGALLRRIVCLSEENTHKRRDEPVFHAFGAKHAGKIPDVNWYGRQSRDDCNSPVTASIKPHWVSLDTGMLKRSSCRHPCIPSDSPNPLFEFHFSGQRYVVDGISVLQRMVATRDPLFTTLLSPFRQLAVTGRIEEGIASVVIDTNSLKELGMLQRQSLISDVDASCLAFWCCNGDRLTELDRCATSIQAGGELHLPQASVNLYCQVRGVRSGDTVYVQSLANGVSASTHRDLLWRGDWSAVRVTRPGAHSGVEISDRHREYWHGQLFKDDVGRACSRRPLSKHEARSVRELAGWKKFSQWTAGY